MISSDPKDHSFGGIFKVLTKKEFLDRPESILSYMRDADFQKIVVNVVETLIGFERRRFLLSVTCPEDEVGGHVHTMSENCYLSEKVVGDIVRGIRSEIYREPVKTRIIQFGDRGDCRYALDGSAVYSMDLTELLSVDESVTEFEIPESVKVIGECAFEDCRLLEKIDIPETVERINDYAFVDCRSLLWVKIPDTILYIGKSVFDGCSALYDISILNDNNRACNKIHSPNGSFGVRAFSECSSLSFAAVPKSITEIGASCFEYCYCLSRVTIPDSVKKIGLSAFASCLSLDYINLPNSIVSIDECAFEGCVSLQKITIPNSVETIGSEAFKDCTGLKKVILSDHLEKIEDNLFENCSSLIEITIPASVSYIGEDAFDGCTSLQHIVIPDSVKEMKYAPLWLTNLRSVSVPADLDVEDCFPETTEIIRRPHP